MQTGHPHSVLAIAAMTYNHVEKMLWPWVMTAKKFQAPKPCRLYLHRGQTSQKPAGLRSHAVFADCGLSSFIAGPCVIWITSLWIKIYSGDHIWDYDHIYDPKSKGLAGNHVAPWNSLGYVSIMISWPLGSILIQPKAMSHRSFLFRSGTSKGTCFSHCRGCTF